MCLDVFGGRCLGQGEGWRNAFRIPRHATPCHVLMLYTTHTHTRETEMKSREKGPRGKAAEVGVAQGS